MSRSMSREERGQWLNKRMDSTATIRAMRDASSPLDVALWLSPSETGRILGVSGQWITQLARKGEIDAVPTALGWLIDPESVEEYRLIRIRKLEGKIAAMKKDEGLVQVFNPKIERYVLIGSDDGQILAHKSDEGPYPDIPIAEYRTIKEPASRGSITVEEARRAARAVKEKREAEAKYG